MVSMKYLGPVEESQPVGGIKYLGPIKEVQRNKFTPPQPRELSWYERLPAGIRAIPPTISGTGKEVLKQFIPGGKYAVEPEAREELGGPLGVKELAEAQSQMTEQELLNLEMTGKWPERIPKPKTVIGSVAPEVKSAIEWAAAGPATKGASKILQKEAPGLYKILTKRLGRGEKALPTKEAIKQEPIVSGMTKEEVSEIVPPFTKAEKDKIANNIKAITGDKPTAADMKIIEQEAKVATLEKKIEPVAQEVKPKMVELRHYTGEDITKATQPDEHGIVWFTEGESYIKGPPKKPGQPGKWSYVTEKVPEDKILRIDENPEILDEYLASSFGKMGRSKANEMAFAESKGYVAVKRGQDVAMRAQEAKLEEMKPKVTPRETPQQALDRLGEDEFIRQAGAMKFGEKGFVLANELAEGRAAKIAPTLKPSLESLEAQVKGGMGIQPPGGLPKYAEGSAINLERLKTTDEVKNIINTITKENESKIGKQVKSWAETEKEAIELGWNMDDVRKAFNKKGGLSQAEHLATREINLSEIKKTREMIASLPHDKSQWTPEMRASLMDAIDNISITSKVATEAGRSLNIYKKVVSGDIAAVTARDYNRVMNTLKGKGLDRSNDVIEALAKVNFDNPAEVNQFIYSITKTPWEKMKDGVYEVWMNMLLSNPMTHIVNTTSNAMVLASQYPERKIASLVEKARAGAGVFGGKKPEIFWNENTVQKFAHIKAIQDAATKFAAIIRSGGSAVSKLEERVSALPPSVRKYMPGRALELEDDFFKVYIQSLELNRFAGRQALKEGLSGQAARNRTIELLKAPTQQMLEAAAEKSKELTFQSDLGKIGRAVMRVRNEVPLMKYFIPFVRTPLNIARYGLERTPLNIPRIAYKVSKGQLEGAAFSEEVAKVITGGMLASTAYLLSEQGYFTGGGPKNKVERDELYRTGWQPYSLHIGNKYYSLERLEPIASIMGMAADMSELKDHMTENEKVSIGQSIAGAIAKNFTNKTFTTGFSRVIDAVSNPGEYLDNLVESMSGTVVPSVVGGVVRAIDPVIRQSRTVMERIKQRIPVVAKSVPARYTIWGEPVERPRGTPLGVPEQVMRFLSPIQVSESKGYLIDNELARLKLNIEIPSRKVQGKELSDEQYANLIKISGSKSLQQLNDAVKQEWYKKMSDKQKESFISKVINKNRDYAKRVVGGTWVAQSGEFE
jgi:hypothetical protein